MSVQLVVIFVPMYVYMDVHSVAQNIDKYKEYITHRKIRYFAIGTLKENSDRK